MQFQTLPKTCQAVILGTIVAALVAAAVALQYLHLYPFGFYEILAACVVCSALEMVQIELTAEKSRMSLSFAGLLGVVMLFGPLAGAIVGLVEGSSGNFVRHDAKTHKYRFAWPDSTKLIFNTFNHSLSACCAGLVYVWGGGLPGYVSQASIRPALFATATYFLINTWGTAAVVATSRGLDIVSIWHENFLWTAPQSLMSASSVVAGLWVYTRYTKQAWIALLFLPPIYVVYYSYRLYMDKIRRDLEHISALNNLNNSVIASLATAIDAKDHYTNKHLSRVQTYALTIAEHIGLPADEFEAVRCAALVHDIGKLGVPENILTKPGKLTPEEYERMKEHVEIGAAILRPVQFPWPVVDVVMGHHERWDGLGYPQGLSGEDIPIGARVIALADVFDALTSDRPYRKAMTQPQAMEYVRQHAGTHFDPKVVEALIAVLDVCQRRIAEMGDGDPIGLEAVGRADPKISSSVMQQIARANSEFFAMYDVSQTLRGALTLDSSMNAVIEKIQGMHVPFDTCAIFLEDGENMLTVSAVAGLYKDLLFGMRIAPGEGLSGRAFEDLQVIINAPATNDVGRKVPHTETLELNAALVVPLRANGKTLGTISVYHAGYNIYTEDHARLLTLIADHAANTIESARRLQESQEMALTDALTGLPNARSLNNALTARLDESRRTRDVFAIMLIDLDNFKLVNDLLGHLRGDEILRISAAAMQGCVRNGDLLARYAGDEFILVMPNSSHEVVKQIRDRIEEAVRLIPIDDRIRLGASIGHAFYPEDGLNARDLIEIADSRMYMDKNRRKQAGEPAD
jgi:diguanylate cyclase (GGDEF)-like protein/putative nucleotidyltransferase with HDIG domain